MTCPMPPSFRGDFQRFLPEIYLGTPAFAAQVAARITRAGRNETLLFLATDGSAADTQVFKEKLEGETLFKM